MVAGADGGRGRERAIISAYRQADAARGRFFGHLKAERPHLDEIRDPDLLRRKVERLRPEYHARIGYVTPDLLLTPDLPPTAKRGDAREP
jgi:hypothetical protein